MSKTRAPRQTCSNRCSDAGSCPISSQTCSVSSDLSPADCRKTEFFMLLSHTSVAGEVTLQLILPPLLGTAAAKRRFFCSSTFVPEHLLHDSRCPKPRMTALQIPRGPPSAWISYAWQALRSHSKDFSFVACISSPTTAPLLSPYGLPETYVSGRQALMRD